ncbi:MAG: tRNA (adenosine(37)-N6)-threonylcarbamoyltransferase complex ATPase subunit type 1 TsaE [Firmicutes bacterium]|nr:tRNA (adenosine(37)-N6)-threonylcarbamoyltransferase complex ATPase subunit type 1 TsaE [Bacillota bacterium]
MRGIPVRQIPISLPTADETRAFGRACGRVVQPGTVLALSGRLGAGKTTFVEGLAQGLASSEEVSSPTFALAACYAGGRLPLYHLDLYRLGEAVKQEVDWLDEYLYSDGVAAVEWAELLGALLPADRLDVYLEDEGGAGRMAYVAALGRAASTVLEAWMQLWR